MQNFINIEEKIILAYNLKPDRLEIVKEKAKIFKYRIIEIEDNQTYCIVEDLIYENYEHCLVEDATEIDMEFLLFVNIINDDLYGFIDELKKEKLYFPNKAILTETSMKWKLRQLLAENKEEHVVMTMFTNLRRAMKKAEILKNQGIVDDELVELMKEAKHYLNPREFDFDEMKSIHNRLANKVNILGEKNEKQK